MQLEAFELCDDDKGMAAAVASIEGGSENVEAIYPLSPLQEGLLFHHVMNQQQDTYILSSGFEIASRDCAERFISSLQTVIDHHQGLRSVIRWQGLARPLQVICRRAILRVYEVLLDESADAVEQLRELMRPWNRTINFSEAPLIRFTLASKRSGGPLFGILHVHHIICDHQSLNKFVSEALAQFEGRAAGIRLEINFGEYVKKSLDGFSEQSATEFFSERLGDIASPSVPFGMSEARPDPRSIEESRDELDADLARRIRDCVGASGFTPARIFHVAWALTLAFTCGSEDVVFGTVMLPRREWMRGMEAPIGLAINTLPLRVRLADASIAEVIQQVHRDLRELKRHGNAPLTLAQKCSGVGAGAQLIGSLLNYRRTLPYHDLSSATGVKVLAQGEAWTNYGTTVTVDDSGERFTVIVKTHRSIGAKRVLRFFTTAVASLMHKFECAQETAALSVEVLPREDLLATIRQFHSRYHRPYPEDMLIHKLFMAKARATPNARAVEVESQSLTYADLDAKSNQLARHLRHIRVGPEDLVGICVQRSLELATAIFGVLKSGAAYVPLDPDYPTDHIEKILADAAPKVLLTQQHVRKSFKELALPTIALDAQWQEISKQSSRALNPQEFGMRADHLAYVIYTSGSTGKPKGVMIQHRSVLSLWSGLEQIYEQVECSKVGVNASFNFDASVKQWIQILSGRTIVLIPQKLRQDPPALFRFLQSQRVDAIDCTPSQIQAWGSAGMLDGTRAGHPKLVLIGGEPIGGKLWSALASCGSLQAYNVYGPTESTVDATFSRIENPCTPNIGRPMDHRSIYILNRYCRPVPWGVVGEIYIGGPGVARGYLGRPDLTADRFLPDIFSDCPGARMYRTGDLGRWREDGSVEYMGRNDYQVKVRGFRIEVGEIEAQLATHIGVSECVVCARTDASEQICLIAYVKAKQGYKLTPPELRNHLSLLLPRQMLPAAFVILERMPLSPNGKVDRRALPEPGPDALVSQEYEAPRDNVEEALAEIWKSLLKVPRVGRADNFFELGGHSLLAMQLVARVKASMQVDLPIKSLFENPTLSHLAEEIALARKHGSSDVEDGESELEELLRSVAEMSEKEAKQLLREITMGGHHE